MPAFTLELDDARTLLRPDRSPALRPSDRHFLLGVVNDIQAALATVNAPWRPLHGSPHDANWLVGSNGLVLLDFETARCGPVEWDLAAWPDNALALFPLSTGELIFTLRQMRRVCVAAKCWVAPDRAPELREAAHVHLKLLRGEPLD